MDSTRFDHLAIAVGQRSTRRYALGLLAAVGLTGLLSEDAAAACLASGRAAGAGGDHVAPACARDPRAEDLPLSAADLLPVRHRLGSLRLRDGLRRMHSAMRGANRHKTSSTFPRRRGR